MTAAQSEFATNYEEESPRVTSQPVFASRLAFMAAFSLAALVACGGGGDDGAPASGGHTGYGQGGAYSLGGQSGGKTATSSGGANTNPSSGGRSNGTGGAGSAGLGVARGGTGPGVGGTLGSSGIPGLPSMAGYPAVVPPPAASDGSSPYLHECHGITDDCVDVANLRCLGIRDGTQVNGYSCSNPCSSDADCSSAPSGVAATASCVDFVTQKHCLLVCQSNGTTRACPARMNCYVYPGATIGYCLWAP